MASTPSSNSRQAHAWALIFFTWGTSNQLELTDTGGTTNNDLVARL